jgi:hypothetical protein
MTNPALTVERVERALDTLASRIAAHGDRGRVLLPIYQRLETELATVRAENETLSAALQRAAKLSSDRRAGRLP